MRSRAMLVAAAALVALLVPSSALAGTYTWNLASDFTSTAPGANPDHDHYGGTPWRYAGASSFSSSIRGGLAGWQGSGGQPFVAINATGASISNGGGTFPAGQIAVEPGSSGPAQLLWTSPLAGSVQVSGSISQDDHGTLLPPCTYATTWTVMHGNATLASGSGAGSFSKSATVNPGETVSVSVAAAGLLPNPACDATGVALAITSQGSRPPVTLSTPGNGGLITGGQPTFSGSASTAFGAARTVTVRVYQGSAASGAPLQTLTATRSGTGYSVGPTSPLADGTYTAQAEQDDIASPPDAGFSAANTFQVFSGAPTITLDSLGSKPLQTSTPTFTGVAGAGTVKLTVYPGASTSATPAGATTGTAGAGGRFSVRLGSGLADGQYTALATQGPSSVSAPRTFRIKVHAPDVSIEQPADGSQTSDPNPVLGGAAGTALGDDPRVTVSLFTGASARGTPLDTMVTGAAAGTWSVRWPHRLRLGLYTAQTTQTDDAGHTGLSTSSFRIVPTPKEIGSAVAISRRGAVAVAIGCVSASGRACVGDVLVMTVRSYRAVAGGPVGPLRVLFAYVDIPAGQTLVVRRKVPADVLHALRRARRFSVRVRVGFGTTASAVRRVKIG